MKFKSQTCDYMTMFYKFIETQSGTKIHVIHSDNGTKFLSKNDFLTERGIDHHTFCVGTSQQNGQVERKHRHILEVT